MTATPMDPSPSSLPDGFVAGDPTVGGSRTKEPRRGLGIIGRVGLVLVAELVMLGLVWLAIGNSYEHLYRPHVVLGFLAAIVVGTALVLQGNGRLPWAAHGVIWLVTAVAFFAGPVALATTYRSHLLTEQTATFVGRTAPVEHLQTTQSGQLVRLANGDEVGALLGRVSGQATSITPGGPVTVWTDPLGRTGPFARALPSVTASAHVTTFAGWVAVVVFELLCVSVLVRRRDAGVLSTRH